jgi:alpha-1,3-glucosyltransferase
MDICSSLIVAACIFIRYAVGLWGHSGQNTPPMYGDFEAQRHWMEITSNLEIEDWYISHSKILLIILNN